MEDQPTPPISFPLQQHSKGCHMEGVKEAFKCINTLKSIIKLCSFGLNGIRLLGFSFSPYFLDYNCDHRQFSVLLPAEEISLDMLDMEYLLVNYKKVPILLGDQCQDA